MQIIVFWQGDFRTTMSLPTFKTKYLLIPDPNIVKYTRRLAAGEIALFRKEARRKDEYRVRIHYLRVTMPFGGCTKIYSLGTSTGW